MSNIDLQERDFSSEHGIAIEHIFGCYTHTHTKHVWYVLICKRLRCANLSTFIVFTSNKSTTILYCRTSTNQSSVEFQEEYYQCGIISLSIWWFGIPKIGRAFHLWGIHIQKPQTLSQEFHALLIGFLRGARGGGNGGTLRIPFGKIGEP